MNSESPDSPAITPSRWTQSLATLLREQRDLERDPLDWVEVAFVNFTARVIQGDERVADELRPKLLKIEERLNAAGIGLLYVLPWPNMVTQALMLAAEPEPPRRRGRPKHNLTADIKAVRQLVNSGNAPEGIRMALAGLLKTLERWRDLPPQDPRARDLWWSGRGEMVRVQVTKDRTHLPPDWTGYLRRAGEILEAHKVKNHVRVLTDIAKLLIPEVDPPTLAHVRNIIKRRPARVEILE